MSDVPSPLDAFRALCAGAGASDDWVAHITPGFLAIVKSACAAAYERGSNDGASRSRTRTRDASQGD